MAILERVLVDSPIGSLELFGREGVLVALHFGDAGAGRRALERRFPGERIIDAKRAAFVGPFERYLEGELAAIDALEVDPGGTPFQARVWRALREIPAGQTTSYSQLAIHLGNPKALRAVGLANGSNPIAIVIPCHRVIGRDGSLVGYGGGLERKRWLLAHEGALPSAQQRLFA